MNVNKLLKPFTNVTEKIVTKICEHGPEILIVLGVTGTTAGVVLACKATLTANDVVNESKAEIEKINEVPEINSSEIDSFKTERRKELAKEYIETGAKLLALYSPAFLVEIASITCFLASNHILRKRNIALLAAYTAIDGSFKDYRKRVIERFDEKTDRELLYNIRTEKVEKTMVDPETGKTKKVKETIEIADPNLKNSYARYFDAETSLEYEHDSDINDFVIRAQQSYLNDMLTVKGHVFLNEAYKALGMPETKAGQIVGWLYKKDGSNESGDNYIDFRATKVHRYNAQGEIEEAILLDFNVDGPIIDYI